MAIWAREVDTNFSLLQGGLSEGDKYINIGGKKILRHSNLNGYIINFMFLHFTSYVQIPPPLSPEL